MRLGADTEIRGRKGGGNVKRQYRAWNAIISVGQEKKKNVQLGELSRFAEQ